LELSAVYHSAPINLKKIHSDLFSTTPWLTQKQRQP
jgi:hypothetical protein